MERAADDFDKRVANVLASDPKIAEDVRRLEERVEEDEEEEEIGSTDALPSGEELVQELEQFLREQRREQDEE